MRQNLNDLPAHLPRPIDDGKTDHLLGKQIPQVQLYSTEDKVVDLKKEFQNPSVLFIYPRAGSPLEPNTNPDLWDSIPGARGCTPQSCGFRDLAYDFKTLGFKIYGLSVQSPTVQLEFVQRNHIPFPVLSDSGYELTNQLDLPTFTFEGERLIKRMAFVISGGIIKKVFYPVFPPDKNADEVLSWLKNNKVE
jgi:peroxiredoxin